MFFATQTVYDDVTVHSIKHTRGNFAAAMIQIDNERNVSSAAQVGFTISQTAFPTLALELHNTLFVYKNLWQGYAYKKVSIVHQLCTESNKIPADAFTTTAWNLGLIWNQSHKVWSVATIVCHLIFCCPPIFLAQALANTSLCTAYSYFHSHYQLVISAYLTPTLKWVRKKVRAPLVIDRRCWHK